MRRRLILSLVVLATASTVLTLARPALAAPGQGGSSGSGSSEDGLITARVKYALAGSRGGSDSGCAWTRVDGAMSVPSTGTATWPRTDGAGVTYHLWQQRCDGRVTWFEFPEATPRDLLPELLERLRERELPAPVPVYEHLDPEFGWAYVRVPLDFRAGDDTWRPVSVTASIGPLWATVTAEPVALLFDPGDPAGPSAVACGGDGPVAPYVPEVPGVCSYTYVNASSTSPFDGFHFVTTLTTEWDISWTSSTGAGGPLEGFATSSTAQLAVAEVQGLVTCTGSRPEQGGC